MERKGLCEALLKSGNPCIFKVKNGLRFCGKHKNYDETKNKSLVIPKKQEIKDEIFEEDWVIIADFCRVRKGYKKQEKIV